MRTAHQPPGDSFVGWLAQACRHARETADITTSRVADLYRRSDSNTIKRFEAGKTQPRIDEALSAYSRATGVAPLELVKRAVVLWERNGPRAVEDTIALEAPEDPGLAPSGEDERPTGESRG